jgi:hypothetical protein
MGIVIRELEIDDTCIDDDFDVPVNRKKRETEHLYSAQIKFLEGRKERRLRTAQGDRPDTRAHLVLRTKDLAPKTTLVIPKKGWKIVTLYVGHPSEETVDYLIEEVRPQSPLRGGPSLIYLGFEKNRDRA